MKFSFRNGPVACLLLCTLLALNGCKPDPDPSNSDSRPGIDLLEPGDDVSTTIAGVVVDEGGNPLAGARILVHGQEAVTTAEGTFRLPDIRVPGKRCIVTCRKEGYFTGIRAEIPDEDQVTATRLVLTSSAPTHTLEAGAGGKAVLPNGSEVQLPAGGLVTGSGAPYSGRVDLSVRYQDPSSPEFGSYVAGGDMLARRTDGSTRMLYSYGILRVKLTGAGNQDLQVAPGKTAALAVHIPDSQLATAPSSIPLWYFDEALGAWQEEGSATRQGNQYVGTVKHFTDWNCDDPRETATVTGTLVDCAGRPVGGRVSFGQTAGQVESTDQTNADARFTRIVPAGVATEIIVHRPFSHGPVTAAGGSGLQRIAVPPLEAGQVYNTGAIKLDPCPNVVKLCFKTKPGDQAQSLLFRVIDGGPNPTATGKVQSIQEPAPCTQHAFPPSATISLTAQTNAGIAVTRVFQTTTAGQTLDLGEIDLTGTVNLVTVTDMVRCGNTPLAGAAVKIDWPGGSASATSNAQGVYSLSVPGNVTAVLTITHEKGTGTQSFRTPTSGTYAAGLIDVCAPASATGENSFVITGGGFNNTLNVISPNPYPNSLAYYDRDKNQTSLGVQSKTDTLGFSLLFLGKTTGPGGKSNLTGARIYRKVGTRTINYYAAMGFGAPGTDVDVTVTRYDAVKGLVEGTFSGTFSDDAGNLFTVTNGKFSVVRGNDLSFNECQGYCL